MFLVNIFFSNVCMCIFMWKETKQKQLSHSLSTKSLGLLFHAQRNVETLWMKTIPITVTSPCTSLCPHKMVNWREKSWRITRNMCKYDEDSEDRPKFKRLLFFLSFYATLCGFSFEIVQGEMIMIATIAIDKSIYVVGIICNKMELEEVLM